MNNLDIYFSAKCQLSCPYCKIPRGQDNEKVREAILNGSFARNVNSFITKEIESIGFWGLEPTINKDLFQRFVYDILDNNEQIKFIMMPTNLQEPIFDQIIIPLFDYAKKNQRKLFFVLQISIDGPPEIQDAHRGASSFAHIIQNVNEIVMNMPKDKYFRLKLMNKSTLTAEDLYTSPDEWWNVMNFFNTQWQAYTHYSLKIKMDNPPTIAIPGNYSKDDGVKLCEWGIDFSTKSNIECGAGNNSFTIDYLGNIYDCHMLVNKKNPLSYSTFLQVYNQLRNSNEVTEPDKDKLFKAVSHIYCWAMSDKGLDSYLKLLGNGALSVFER